MKKLFCVLLVIPLIALAGCSSAGAGSDDPDEDTLRIIITDIPAKYADKMIDIQIYEGKKVFAYGGGNVSGTSLTSVALEDADGNKWTGDPAVTYSIDLDFYYTPSGGILTPVSATIPDAFTGGAGAKTVSAAKVAFTEK
jgi:hypothetical protein